MIPPAPRRSPAAPPVGGAALRALRTRLPPLLPPLLLALALLACGWGAAAPSAPGGTAAPNNPPVATPGALVGEHAAAYYLLERLNAGLPPADPPPNLQTPQAALEHFVLRSREGDWQGAARALNLNLIPEGEQARRAPELARRLYALLDRRNLIAWDEVPDRPDGLVEALPGTSDALAGEPRRSLELGVLDLGERDARIALQRVRVQDAAPLWVFSPQTVENVPALYDRLGPGPVDRWMPQWARRRLLGEVPLWEWGALLLLVLASLALGRLVARLLWGWWRRTGGGTPARLLEALARPLALTVATVVLFATSSSEVLFSGGLLRFLQPLFWVLLVAAVTWLGMRAFSIASERIGERFVSGIEQHDSERARKHRTALSVVRRVFIFLVVLVGFGVGLSHFTSLELVGTTLLTSAGVASVVLGIAAQPVLGNIVAGLQLALTQPVRIGDSVYIQDNWGYVEDLGYTFAVIRTWDHRRLMIPLRHLVTTPYENWSIKDAHMVQPILLYADYRVDVQRVREKFEELLRDDERWDERQDPVVQVTAVTDEVVEIRALCSAADPVAAWYLHCDLREALLAFLRDLDGGAFLPRRRLELSGVSGEAREALAGAPAPAGNGRRGAPEAREAHAPTEGREGGASSGGGPGAGAGEGGRS